MTAAIVSESDLARRVGDGPMRRGWLGGVWRRVRDFAGWGGEATYLWPRWLVLRAVGFVYLYVFAGIITEAPALVGPQGIGPLDGFLAQQLQTSGGWISAVLAAPSLFWINSSGAAVGVLAWTGMAAAVALLLNLWPRMALFACWLVFLSFASTWRAFSPAQLDNLMIETALLCIPFAPAGFRPGLGAHSPPRPIAVFMVRWLLFRVMFESGVVKLTAGDSHWRDFTAMDVMYETAPFPTIFGYFDHQLGHAYHLFEISLTFMAELVAPVAAVFGGRRGRWFAFWVWVVFQAGIQLTCNFGWLNTASLGLGLLLLDDQMLAAAADRLRLRALSRFLARKAGAGRDGAPVAAVPSSAFRFWRWRGLSVALWLHFGLTWFFFAKACGLPPELVPRAVAWPVNVLAEFRSINGYFLYAAFDPVRYQVEFEGSNDGGRTWRSYEYRYMPQRVDAICPFIAPWFARFEATMQIAALNGRKSTLYPVVASHLLARNPVVMGLFRRDPFPDRPPTIIRMRGYRFTFTDLATYKESRRFWTKEPMGDYLPALYVNDTGQIDTFDLASADAALAHGNFAVALPMYEEQYRLGNANAGFRLADLYVRGIGVRPDPARVFSLYRDLAARGEVGAEHNLGICHEYGVGTPIDYTQAAEWYRRAAAQGYALSLYSLGGLYAQDRILPRQDFEALVVLLEAEEKAAGNDPATAAVREDRAGYVRRLTDRMSPSEVAKARILAKARIKSGDFVADLRP